MRKYGPVIGIIAVIGTLIVAFVVWGSNGSEKGSPCTETPAGRSPPAIICPRNATPENSNERGCIRRQTVGNVTYWTCSD